MFIKPIIPTRFTILFSHGNAVDIGQMCSFYVLLAYRLGCNVFAYDYSGFLNFIINILKAWGYQECVWLRKIQSFKKISWIMS